MCARKSIRVYRTGQPVDGQRHRATDPYPAFADYVKARLIEDPYLWGSPLWWTAEPRLRSLLPAVKEQPPNPGRSATLVRLALDPGRIGPGQAR